MMSTPASTRRHRVSRWPSAEGPAVPERLGLALGWAVAPLFALTSFLRQARTFHPAGVVARAEVEALPSGRWLGELLAGPALVRFSGALWKSERHFPDVLGCAIRFRASPRVSPEPEEGDQDLLFATIRKPWTMPFAPLATDVRDYLSNRYFAVSPFDVPDFGRVFFRAVPEQRSPDTGLRGERLAGAIAARRAQLRLEVRHPHRLAWTPVARVRLVELVAIDQARLSFDPFRAGRALVPRGLVHAMRRGAYAASQAARPASAVSEWRRAPA